jgi:enamine deaminase RidA (YjgF/YER057c/UK114 family)
VGRRVSIEMPGFAHANPVPVAARIGCLLVSGVLTGRDPATRTMPPDLDTQVVNVFARVHELLETAGGTVDDVLKLTFWVADYRDRDAINRAWESMFPDPADRPARQVMAAHLDGGALVHADVMAVLGAAPPAG